MRIEQGVKVFDCNENIFGQGVTLNEFFIHQNNDGTYMISGCDEISFYIKHKGICTLGKAIEIAKLLNQDDATFSMFNNWKPDIEVSESVLKEFILFWTNKPDVKKNNEQWLHALTQSQQYADSRDEYYRTKGDNHG